MKKKQLKKMNPGRRRGIELLREGGSMPTPYTDSKGREIWLNAKKHFLLNKPYKRDEYKDEMNRRIGEYITTKKEEVVNETKKD